MLKQFWLMFPLTAMLIAVGCSQAVAPTQLNLPPGIPPGAVNGEYGFNLNGKTYDSGIPNSEAGGAALNPGKSVGEVSLFVSLFYDFNNGVYGDVQFSIPISVPKPQSMPISNSSASQGIHATATIDCDSMGYIYYGALPGGIVNITKFDTINNLVSGTFEFNASETSPNVDPTKTSSITTGYFNDVPIEGGGYGQGNVSAILNGSSFTANNSGFEYVAANLEGGSLFFWANGQGTQLDNEITIQGIPIGLGSYLINDSSTALNFYYWNWGNEKENIGSRNPGSTGQVTITMCDTANRRISGTFQFSGIDSLGNTVSVSNGVITNVQWAPWQ